ncbi:glycosyltransferase family 2 protein [Winogradskyella jejuensis]|uniref:Glycosyltransferase involved in cell wall bisynthesis n=1 Tax=Winogradskyella jejuensis TaxID=1089305 RepID=A0A1M5SGW8_9FLAO|nr:glycosyltransferase family 2 protein [Winogradskyella jejuensis]SHH37528.1 Glycosyltransferase involved in cell wall bisynthesis [Winogradskyella jejuensis]
MAYRLTILVPAYNEYDNLNRLEKELSNYLAIASVSTCVTIINDGSTDNSQVRIEEICMRNKDFSFIQLKQNYGLSTALKVGFDHTETELVGYIDADLQTAPKDFNLLLEHIDHYQLVTGVRTNRKDNFLKKIISKIANSTRRVFTKDGMDDTGCPLKIFQTKYAKCIPLFRGLHRFLPAMILLQNGKIKQIPVNHFPRTAGKTKFNLGNRFIGPIIDCFAYLWIKRKYINYEIEKKN